MPASIGSYTYLASSVRYWLVLIALPCQPACRSPGLKLQMKDMYVRKCDNWLVLLFVEADWIIEEVMQARVNANSTTCLL